MWAEVNSVPHLKFRKTGLFPEKNIINDVSVGERKLEKGEVSMHVDKENSIEATTLVDPSRGILYYYYYYYLHFPPIFGTHKSLSQLFKI